MTDKEIIKALKCCLSGKEELCKECPLNGKCYGDIDYLLEFALDLINRQQEMLEAANGQETLQKALAEKDKEIERLNNNISAMAVTTHNCAKETEAEAIIAFAERLKKECLIDRGYEILHEGTIDNLVKEMIGE